ncbi:MAG: hypothetical protein ACI4TK_15535 [Agathobacter sp.]
MDKKRKYVTPSISVISYGSDEYSKIMSEIKKQRIKDCSNQTQFDKEEYESIDDYHIDSSRCFFFLCL